MIALPTFRGCLSGFSPLSLGPAVWLDASDTSTLYNATSGGSLSTAGGIVRRIEDKSGNARHFLKTGFGDPVRVVSVYNGKDCVRLGGSQSLGLGGFTVSNPYTLFLVCLQNSTAATSYARALTGIGALGVFAPLRGIDNLNIYLNFATVRSGDWAGVNQLGISTFTAIANNSASLHYNGAVQSLNSFTSVMSFNGVGIGNNDEPLHGDFLELIILPYAATASQRLRVNSFLSQKYAIPLT